MTETAAVIGTNTGYILLALLPPVLWLLFYLREDAHPEPKLLLILAFIGGIFSAVAAVVGEYILIGRDNDGLLALLPSIEMISLLGYPVLAHAFIMFLGIGAVEEYTKYLAVKFLILRRKDFDEPVDAMVYMMTAALGFAAIENTLFLFPVFRENFPLGVEVAISRFLGANLLHALASGIVGFFLARAWFSPRRHHFVALGIALAAILHTFFNYFILTQERFNQSAIYIISLLLLMAVMVLIDFERLKRRVAPNAAQMPPDQEIV
ncbi:MAG: PrsW family intramembrane metalloprotease [Candidatus Sungbacteria bacterium]|nr:PrsW family intramembrane metalloprotease [Candidatus Sungbacteria bacterium]